MRFTVKEFRDFVDNLDEDNPRRPELEKVYAEIISGKRGSSNTEIENYIQAKMEEAVKEEGNGLTCQLCHESTSILYAGACEPCFKGWALEVKAKQDERKARK